MAKRAANATVSVIGTSTPAPSTEYAPVRTTAHAWPRVRSAKPRPIVDVPTALHRLTLVLLDAARVVTGSDSETARRAGVRPKMMNEWRSGRRASLPEDLALIAEVAGRNPLVALGQAVLAKHEGKPRAERLKHALRLKTRPGG